MASSSSEDEKSPILPGYFASPNGNHHLHFPGVLAINDETSALNPKEEYTSVGHNPHGDKKINSKYAIWNLFNDVLSPGTVALPFYMYQAGLTAGVFLLIAFGLLTGYTLMEVYLMYMKYNKKSYVELAEFVFGKWGYGLMCLAIFCFNFGGLCAQLILFGTVVPDILTYFFGVHAIFSKRNLILIGCCIFLPISFLKDIAKYTFTSFLSVSCIFIITLLVIFRLIDRHPGDYAPPSNDPYALVHYSVFSALGGLAYIYVCHDLSFNVIGSLENPTPRRYRRVVFATMLGTVLSTGLIGISGYLLFYNQVANDNGNILENFPRTDTVATIGRALLAFDVTLTIPFTCFMPRISIIAVISAIGPRSKKAINSRIGFCCVTVFVLFSAVTIAILVDNLGDVFELVGGVSACSLAFLFPPLLIMKQMGLRNLSPFKAFMTVFTLACGLAILLGSTIDIFY